MAFLPLTTTLVAIVVGVYGAAYFQGLQASETDTILTVICRRIQDESRFGYWLVVVLFASVLAAIMSTADSVLLSISSMITKDIYGVHWSPHASEEELTKFGKRFSWLLMVCAVVAAIVLRDTTLVKLLDRKFDLLVQLVPVFILSLYWSRMSGGATFWGVLVGVAVAIGLATLGYAKIAGIHAGLFGLAANFCIVIAGSYFAAPANRSP